MKLVSTFVEYIYFVFFEITHYYSHAHYSVAFIQIKYNLYY